MDRTHAEELITALVDGELDDAGRRELDALLEADPSLRERLAAEQAVADRLRAAGDPPLPEGFAVGVMDRVRTAAAPGTGATSEGGGGGILALWPWLVTGGALAAGILGMVAFHEPPTVGGLAAAMPKTEAAADRSPATGARRSAEGLAFDDGPAREESKERGAGADRELREKTDLAGSIAEAEEVATDAAPPVGGLSAEPMPEPEPAGPSDARTTGRAELPKARPDRPQESPRPPAGAKGEQAPAPAGGGAPPPASAPAPEPTWSKGPGEPGEDEDEADGVRLADKKAAVAPARFALVYVVDDLEGGRRAVESALQREADLFVSRVWIDPAAREGNVRQGLVSDDTLDAVLPDSEALDGVRGVLRELGHEGDAAVAHLRVRPARLAALRDSLDRQGPLRETIARRLFADDGGDAGAAGSRAASAGAKDRAASGSEPDADLLERLREEARVGRTRDPGEPAPPPRPDADALDRMRKAPPAPPRDVVTVEGDVTDVEVEVILVLDPRARSSKGGR